MYLKKALERIKKLKWQFLQGRKEHAGCWEGFFPDFSMNSLVALSDEIERLRKLNLERCETIQELKKCDKATADLIKRMRNSLITFRATDKDLDSDIGGSMLELINAEIDEATAWLKEHDGK